MHAAMNGQAHVLSYLLNIGVDPNLVDSSGNAALHYAVAYGWYFCAKQLLDFGVDVNAANEWRVRSCFSPTSA